MLVYRLSVHKPRACRETKTTFVNCRDKKRTSTIQETSLQNGLENAPDENPSPALTALHTTTIYMILYNEE
jgi:hypothetical protein